MPAPTKEMRIFANTFTLLEVPSLLLPPIALSESSHFNRSNSGMPECHSLTHALRWLAKTSLSPMPWTGRFTRDYTHTVQKSSAFQSTTNANKRVRHANISQNLQALRT